MKFSALVPRSLGEARWLFLFIFLSFIISPPAFAQTQTAQPNYTTPNTDPNVPKNLHTWTQNVMLEVVSAMSCELGGIDPTNPNQPCLGVDQKTGKIGFVPNGGGAVGVMGNMIAMTFTPPLHTGDYFNYLSQNFGITKRAYADNGIGFKGLSPLIGLWSAFRNIVYLLFVIVFIVIGLAIMLRIKIDPRTVMSIENQIPKIIIGLLLVTFSFAIAGFLVDMMYTSIYLAANTISPGTDLSKIQGETPFGVVQDTIPGGVSGIASSSAESTKKIIQKSLGIHPYDPILDLPFANLLPSAMFGLKTLINADINIMGKINELKTPKIDIPYFGTLQIPYADLLPFGGPLVMLNALVVNVLNASQPAIDTFFNNTSKLGFFTNNNTPMDQLINIISTLAGVGTFMKTSSGPNIPIRILGFGSDLPTGFFFGLTYGIGVFGLSELLLREWLPYYIPYLIILIALLWALFRLWFQLIIAYVFILIDVVLAPFWIAAGILPGVSAGFGMWLRDIIANLSAFPVTITMFLLGKVFMDAFSSNNNSLFVPPLIGNPTGGNASPIGSLIGLGIILMTPQVVTMTREALKAPQFKYTAAIGQAMGVGASTPIGGAKSAAGAYFASKQAILQVGNQPAKAGGIAGAFRSFLGV